MKDAGNNSRKREPRGATTFSKEATMDGGRVRGFSMPNCFGPGNSVASVANVPLDTIGRLASDDVMSRTGDLLIKTHGTYTHYTQFLAATVQSFSWSRWSSVARYANNLLYLMFINRPTYPQMSD